MAFNPKYPSPYKHVIMSQQFVPAFLEQVFFLADQIREDEASFRSRLQGFVIAEHFSEASTRTWYSFGAAAVRLGAHLVCSQGSDKFSSEVKGESLEDSIRVISGNVHCIVLRHVDDDSSRRAVAVSKVPIINAGSGKTQHPTQALLDAYTIQREFGQLHGLKIGVAGDLTRGRTCDSLVYNMAKYQGNSFHFVAPYNCKPKPGLLQHLREHGVPFTEHEALEEVVKDVDVLYMTRVQTERFDDPEEAQSTRGKLILYPHLVELMRDAAIIMHPLPRVDELPKEIDANHRARYFEQADNGLWVRMALLVMLLKPHP